MATTLDHPTTAHSLNNTPLSGPDVPSRCIAYVWFTDQPATHREKEQNQLPEKNDFKLPTPLVFSPQFPICRVSCGLSLAAFITDDGRVFTWRLPEEKHVKHLGCPKILNVLNGRHVTDVACGDHHICCLCDNGEILTTGCYHYGQLGTMPSTNHADEIPEHHQNHQQYSLTQCLCGKSITAQEALSITDVFLLTFNAPVVDIACGSRQTLVVTSEGGVWGMGQGVGGWESSKNEHTPASNSSVLETVYSVPKHIQLDPAGNLSSLRIQQIACGAAHFLALTNTGSVISWGKNSSGELGHGTESPNELPKLVTFSQLDDVLMEGVTVTESQPSSTLVFVDAALASLAISDTGDCWMWGCFGWRRPHKLYDNSAIGLPSTGWSRPSRDTVCLSSTQLTRLRADGLLAVSALTDHHTTKSVLLRENTMNHFDVIGSSERVTIGIALVDGTRLLSKANNDYFQHSVTNATMQQESNLEAFSSVSSPPSFGETRSSPVKGTSTYEKPLASSSSNQQSSITSYKPLVPMPVVARCDSMDSTACTSATEESLSYRSRDERAFQSTKNPHLNDSRLHHPCLTCAEKDNAAEELRAQVKHLESELAKFLGQYERDLLTVSETLNKEKKLKEKLEKELLKVTEGLSEEDLDDWAVKLQHIVDTYSCETERRSTLKQYTNPILLTPVTRIVQKLKYVQSQADVYKEQATASETAATQYARKLDNALCQLSECESRTSLLRDEKERIEEQCQDWERKATEAKDKLERLNEKCLDKEKCVRDLRQNVQDLQAEVETLHQDREKLKELQESFAHESRERKLALEKLIIIEGSKRRLQQSYDEVQEGLANAKITVEKLETRVSDLTYELRTAQHDNEMQKSEKERLEEEAERCQRMRDHFEKQTERLRKSLLDAATEALEKGKQEALERAQLVAKLHALETNLQDARNEVDTLQHERAQWNDPERLRMIAADTEKLHQLEKQNEELRAEVEAVKTQTELQLQDLSDRNVALIRQINTRIAEEQCNSEKAQAEFIAHQEEVAALKLKYVDAKSQYSRIVTALRDLNLLSTPGDEEGNNPSGEANYDGITQEGHSSESKLRESEEEPGYIANVVEQNVNQLREEVFSNTAALEALTAHVETLELQLKLQQPEEEKSVEPTVCGQCETLQMKVAALETEVLEKQKILDTMDKIWEPKTASSQRIDTLCDNQDDPATGRCPTARSSKGATVCYPLKYTGQNLNTRSGVKYCEESVPHQLEATWAPPVAEEADAVVDCDSYRLCQEAENRPAHEEVNALADEFHLEDAAFSAHNVPVNWTGYPAKSRSVLPQSAGWDPHFTGSPQFTEKTGRSPIKGVTESISENNANPPTRLSLKNYNKSTLRPTVMAHINQLSKFGGQQPSQVLGNRLNSVVAATSRMKCQTVQAGVPRRNQLSASTGRSTIPSFQMPCVPVAARPETAFRPRTLYEQSTPRPNTGRQSAAAYSTYSKAKLYGSQGAFRVVTRPPQRHVFFSDNS